jgi:hypothetical protein
MNYFRGQFCQSFSLLLHAHLLSQNSNSFDKNQFQKLLVILIELNQFMAEIFKSSKSQFIPNSTAKDAF